MCLLAEQSVTKGPCRGSRSRARSRRCQCKTWRSSSRVLYWEEPVPPLATEVREEDEGVVSRTCTDDGSRQPQARARMPWNTQACTSSCFQGDARAASARLDCISWFSAMKPRFGRPSLRKCGCCLVDFPSFCASRTCDPALCCDPLCLQSSLSSSSSKSLSSLMLCLQASPARLLRVPSSRSWSFASRCLNPLLMVAASSSRSSARWTRQDLDVQTCKKSCSFSRRPCGPCGGFA
mmetsp:Transcript_15191/g.44987  ORF Transcript_15191/g.44987 Transcript_15191/m.44987 type:complete len:236 (+) Transcript_15191:224-931(+)